MSRKWASEDEKAWWSRVCYDSFWWFAREAYNIDGNPQGGWLAEPVHKPLCEWFEKHVKSWERNRRKGARYQTNLMVVIPREFGKTTLITRAGLLWVTLRNPEASIFIGSETKERAAEFFQPLQPVLNGEDPYQKFTMLFGNWFSKDRIWKNTKLVHAARKAIGNQDPSFGTWGVATGLTGVHPDVLCLDDPISYEKMEKDSNWLGTVNEHIASLIPVLKGNGLRIFIGTRYHDGDHLGRQLRKHGARSISGMKCPEVDPKPDGVWNLYYLAARNLKGTPIYPEVWTEEKLQEFQRENDAKYWAQVMNSPSESKHIPLMRSQVDQCWVDKEHVPKNLRISVHIDTAFKYKERVIAEDESVIEVWGHSRDGSGDVYYLEGYGSKDWRAEDFNSQLVRILQRLRLSGRWPYALTDDLEMGGHAGSWEITLKSWCHAGGIPSPPVFFIPRHKGNKKHKRMVEAASYWVDNHVKLVRGAPGVEELIDQMLKIGQSEHDDWADAGADVFYKEIYKPMRLMDNADEGQLVRPYDSELMPGTLTFRQIIDKSRRRPITERYDLID